MCASLRQAHRPHMNWGVIRVKKMGLGDGVNIVVRYLIIQHQKHAQHCFLAGNSNHRLGAEKERQKNRGATAGPRRWPTDCVTARCTDTLWVHRWQGIDHVPMHSHSPGDNGACKWAIIWSVSLRGLQVARCQQDHIWIRKVSRQGWKGVQG